MKTCLVFQLIFQFGIIYVFTLRVREQFYLSTFENEVQAQSENSDKFSSTQKSKSSANKDICNNLFEYLLVFGPNAIHKYGDCDEKYLLLGENNSLIQKDQPECFLSLIPALCQYQVQKNVSLPYPDDIRYFMTKTISRCIKVK